MDSLYTPQVREYIRTRPWPQGLNWAVLEVEDHLVFELYRAEINALPPSEKLRLAPLLNETFSKISNSGIPIVVSVAEGGKKQ